MTEEALTLVSNDGRTILRLSATAPEPDGARRLIAVAASAFWIRTASAESQNGQFSRETLT